MKQTCFWFRSLELNLAITPKQKDCLYSNLVSTNDNILLPVLEKNIFKSEACLGRQSQVTNGTKTNQYIIRPEGTLEDKRIKDKE